MKYNILGKITGLFAVASVLFLASFTPQMTNASHYAQSGMTCMPANLIQAMNGPIAWDHMRVRNDSAGDLWVVCSVPNTLEVDGDGNILSLDGGLVTVGAWFGTNASAGAEVYCILREVGGSTTATTGETVTLTLTASQALPDLENGVMTATGFAGGSAAVTLTCRLAPGTGLQSVNVLLTI